MRFVHNTKTKPPFLEAREAVGPASALNRCDDDLRFDFIAIGLDDADINTGPNEPNLVSRLNQKLIPMSEDQRACVQLLGQEGEGDRFAQTRRKA